MSGPPRLARVGSTLGWERIEVVDLDTGRVVPMVSAVDCDAGLLRRWCPDEDRQVIDVGRYETRWGAAT